MNESKKMLEIIHENHRKQRMINKKVEQKKKRNKFLVLGIVAAVVVIALGFMYNERQVKNCMESGLSENFCRYAGE